MAPDFSNQKTAISQTRKDAGAPPKGPTTAEGNEVVKTFSYDASAGNASAGNVAAKEKERAVAKPASSREACMSTLGAHAMTDLDIVQSVAITHTEVSLDANSGRQKKTLATQRRVPPWLASSLAVHMVLLLLLSLYALPALQKNENFGLSVSTASIEEVDEFQEIEIDSSELMPSIELASELFDPGTVALGELSAESMLSEVTSDAALAVDSLGDLGTLFGENGSGLSDLGTGMGAENAASFFGAKVQGKRILYMLDNSGSMQNGRMETMIAELLKSVESLNPKQQFYVLFYSDTVYGLGHPQPADGFLYADKQNKHRLQQWLETVELCGGNAIDEAIDAAEAVAPDVVFMLSDGHVRTTKSGRKYKRLLDSASRRFTLHTLGMGCGSDTHRDQLLAIAEAHGGTFREVEVQPAMAELAQRRPRPYRNNKNGGGPFWGTSFGK